MSDPQPPDGRADQQSQHGFNINDNVKIAVFQKAPNGKHQLQIIPVKRKLFLKQGNRTYSLIQLEKTFATIPECDQSNVVSTLGQSIDNVDGNTFSTRTR
nr:hypothetical protein [Kushneria phosphatilytica]